MALRAKSKRCKQVSPHIPVQFLMENNDLDLKNCTAACVSERVSHALGAAPCYAVALPSIGTSWFRASWAILVPLHSRMGVCFK